MISNSFINDVDTLCKEKNVEYIDAVIMWCAKHDVEVETAAAWIKKDPAMKSKIQAEAENVNVLKRGATLVGF